MTHELTAAFGIIEGMPNCEKLILLVQDKNKPEPRRWKLPGGKNKEKENPELTVVREINEEIGITVHQPLDTNVIFKKHVEDSHVFIVYRVKYYDGEIMAGTEIEQVAFFEPWHIKQLILADEILPRHAMALTRYLKII